MRTTRDAETQSDAQHQSISVQQVFSPEEIELLGPMLFDPKAHREPQSSPDPLPPDFKRVFSPNELDELAKRWAERPEKKPTQNTPLRAGPQPPYPHPAHARPRPSPDNTRARAHRRAMATMRRNRYPKRQIPAWVTAPFHRPPTPRDYFKQPVHLYVRSLRSERSRRVTYCRLHKVAAVLCYDRNIEPTSYPWHELTYRQAQLIRASLTQNYAPETARAMLCTLRGVLKRCHGLEMMSTEAYHNAIFDLKIDGPSSPEDCGRGLDSEELRLLFSAINQQPHIERRLRDTMILAIALFQGLRISELRRLNVQDVLLDNTGMPTELSFVSKGDQSGEQPIHPITARAIQRWLMLCQSPQGPLHPQGPLILAVSSPWFRERQHRISEREMYRWPRHWAKQAGIEPFSIHDLRRTLISNASDDGLDIATTARFVRHKSITTTARYDKRAQQKKHLHDKIKQIRYPHQDILFSAAANTAAAGSQPAQRTPRADHTTEPTTHPPPAEPPRTDNRMAETQETDEQPDLWMFDVEVIAGMRDTIAQQSKRIQELEAALKPNVEGDKR